MCISEGRVIGLVGGTCAGKTTVGNLLGERLSWARRDCGGLVNARAEELGVRVSELGRQAHEEIDDATREQAACAGDGIVIDGRYLGYVLVGVRGVRMVELTCSRAERSRRHACRMGIGMEEAVAFVDGCDQSDRELCGLLYRVTARCADFAIDTTSVGAETVARRIWSKLGMVW